MKQLFIFLLTVSFVSLLHAQVKSDRTCRCPDSNQSSQHHSQTVIYTYPDHDDEPKRKHKKKHRSNLLHLQIGGAVNHTHGTVGKFEQEINPDLLNGQANGFLGIRMQPRQRRRSNVFGVWATGGLHTLPAVASLMELQNIPTKIDPNTEYHEFREWEVGVLFREWFRISGGQGTQRIITEALETQEVNYFVASTGFSFNILPSVKWNTTATFLFGQDFQEISFRPSTGLSFRFNFL